ncbi:hypothetical protein [Moraxella bovis]|uniref:Uncharacterized protein n=1 Tax=Moraxella bovis TaxID=476 RepID=A0ABY6M2Z6_MORBO|nr:hypothetical protein [Moraxella bovis]UZA02060.1 hypothetical protein LP092_08620 [Moraxella bovis]UZA18305.1 hypothetical protein LP088_08030 [Moraxella bovis]UZA36501.1 hypothetical protein LP098_05905 [Moraxella bovis]
MFLKHFEKILKDNVANDGEGLTVLDVFGGSGLLAHNAKRKVWGALFLAFYPAIMRQINQKILQ